jgi:hypothetical protein
VEAFVESAEGQTGRTKEAVQHEAAQAVEHARTVTQDVAETAKEQARQVTEEAADQARRVARDARDRLSGEIDSQAGRAAAGLRQWAGDLERMADAGSDGSPVRTVVHQLSDNGRRAADYLDEHGIGGVVGEVGHFARRRPGAFLLGAAVTGFLAGRLAKAAAGAGSSSSPEETNDDPSGTSGAAALPATGGPVSSTAADPVPDAAAVPPAPGSYGATPYETGAQATPPPGPTGEVR